MRRCHRHGQAESVLRGDLLGGVCKVGEGGGACLGVGGVALTPLPAAGGGGASVGLWRVGGSQVNQ